MIQILISLFYILLPLHNMKSSLDHESAEAIQVVSASHTIDVTHHGSETPLGVPLVFSYSLIVLVFVFSGLTGHDPWKADEAYVFGVVQDMLESSDWLVPTLAGEPFMEKPPLYYWVAAAFSGALSGRLPVHDGARLASGFFMMLTCGALKSTAQIWWGRNAGHYVILVLIGCLGTLVQSHMMMPDTALVTGFSFSALGFATILSRPGKGGILIGLGAGVGFLSKGLLAPGVIAITAAVLPLCFKEWRMPFYWHGLGVAAVVAVPWCVIWPIELYLRSPTLFSEWFWENNIGRFVGFSVPRLRTQHMPWFWTQTIPWFTFPGLPLALGCLWRRRQVALASPPIQYSLVSFSVLMAVLAVSSSGRGVYAWPLLIPIAVLAAPAASALPVRVDRLVRWGSIGIFGALSAAIWVGWAIMMLRGGPPEWPRLLRVLPSDFVPHFEADRTVLAVLITIGAIIVMRVLWHKPCKGLTAWVVGMTAAWSLLMALWTPWLDYAKSYRSVFSTMPIPNRTNCIASINLGEGERAMLRYITGHNPIRREVAPNASCTSLLVQREAGSGEPDIDLTRWKEIWRGSRPGVTNERFWLFRAAR